MAYLSSFKNEKKSAPFKKSSRSILTDLIHANFQNSMPFLFLHFYLILCTFWPPRSHIFEILREVFYQHVKAAVGTKILEGVKGEGGQF